MDRDTGNSRVVDGTPPDRVVVGISRDGRRVYLFRQDVESDIWLADMPARGHR